MPALVSGGRECQTAESQRESFKRKLRDESKNKKKSFHLKLARKKYLFTSRFLSENTAPNRYELDWNRHRSCRQPPLPGPLLSVSFHRASDGRKYRSKKLLFSGISLLNFKFKKTQEKNYETERIPGKKIKKVERDSSCQCQLTRKEFFSSYQPPPFLSSFKCQLRLLLQFFFTPFAAFFLLLSSHIYNSLPFQFYLDMRETS